MIYEIHSDKANIGAEKRNETEKNGDGQGVLLIS